MNNKDIDMLNGPLTGRLIVYTIPIIISGLLQLLFNAVDMIVVGRYAGESALAAVGSTSSLINLLTNLFIGLSVGANVLTAYLVGAKKEEDTKKCVHTAISMALICGVILAVIGFFTVRPLLILMGAPTNILPLSALYLKIYFLGMPATLLYNYGSAILRAVGDTRNPLYFLSISGVINLILNLVFVIYFGMSVAGVGLATVISQCISAALTLRCLANKDSAVKLNIKNLGIDTKIMFRIFEIGIPAGIQGTLFSLSNVIIQSSINIFGSVAMAGNAAAASIEGFVYMSMNSFHQTTLNFVGQNAGAKQYKRVKKIILLSFLMVSIWGLFAGSLCYINARTLLGFYSKEKEVIDYGVTRILWICVPYLLCGQMEVIVGGLRGLGVAIRPMIISLVGACLFRIIWIATVFNVIKELPVLYVSYPISWIITTSAQIVCLIYVYKKSVRENQFEIKKDY